MSSPSERSAERSKRLQAEAARRERNRRVGIAAAAIAVVVIVVGVLVAVKVAGGGSSDNTSATGPSVAPSALPAVVQAVSNVPASALDSVGVGTASSAPKRLLGGTPLTEDGKAKVLYVGAEFCPYCAATRWGVVVALSRFGTFTNLGLTTSASNDVFPDTATLDFHGSSYSSPYVAFNGYELTDRNHQTLDTPPAADDATFKKFDSPPYVPSNVAGSIPFIDIGGRFFSYGSSYDPQTLHGLSHQEIAADLKDPSSPVAKAILGEANLMTAAICQVNGLKPASVCSSAGVTAATAKLGNGG